MPTIELVPIQALNSLFGERSILITRTTGLDPNVNNDITLGGVHGPDFTVLMTISLPTSDPTTFWVIGFLQGNVLFDNLVEDNLSKDTDPDLTVTVTNETSPPSPSNTMPVPAIIFAVSTNVINP